MDTEHPLALLGGLTPSQFMKRHWQEKTFAGAQCHSRFCTVREPR